MLTYTEHLRRKDGYLLLYIYKKMKTILDQLVEEISSLEIREDDKLEVKVKKYSGALQIQKHLSTLVGKYKDFFKENFEENIDTPYGSLLLQKKSKTVFSPSMSTMEIEALLDSYPEIAKEYAMKMMNTGAGLASYLEPYAEGKVEELETRYFRFKKVD